MYLFIAYNTITSHVSNFYSPGDNCEYCDVGFVGDPTLGETCTPCNEVCFNRSDTCFSLEMACPTCEFSFVSADIQCLFIDLY